MKYLTCAALFWGAASAASASSVDPISYATSGVGATVYGGAYYMDDIYSGTATSGAPRSYSGGLGELTDGVIATENYNFYEGFPSPGPGGPYVAWLNINPEIEFLFAAVTRFATAKFHFDDKNGAAGVGQPTAITINGVSQSVPTNSPATPFSFVFDMRGLAPTASLDVTITRGAQWTFLSEVEFTTATVPLPAAGLLLLAGLCGLGVLRRRT